MKVTREDIIRIAASQNTPKDGKADAAKFDAALRAAFEEEKACHACPVQTVAATSGAPMIDTASFLAMDTSRIVDGADRLLGLLEEFQTKLANTAIPLGELSPLAEKIGNETNLLQSSLDVLPETDPLKDMLNRVLITCSVETEKFKRGDYL